MGEEISLSGSVADGKTSPMRSMMLTGVVAATVAVAGCGGAMLWLQRTGRLPGRNGPAKTLAATKGVPKTHLVALEPLLVNLADQGGRSYLRVGITLRVQDEQFEKSSKGTEETGAKGKPGNLLEAPERDAALAVLGRATAADLLASEGKDRLKAELRTSFSQKVSEANVVDVLFTEFLVQQ